MQRQRYTYRTIRDKKRRGEFVNENPYFAIEDNSREPRKVATALPPLINHFGQPLRRGVNYYVVWYNGQKGLYTEEVVKAYHMSNPQKFEI